MKTKLTKIFGISFALVLIASMMVFAIPAAADPYAPLTPALPNTSQGFPPTAGITGGYFFDPAITKVGPIAEAIDGDLYAYVANATLAAANDIFKSVDGGRSWYPSTAVGKYAGGAVVDMVCSSVSEDVLYVTDGNYIYKSINGGSTFLRVAEDSLENALIGNCGAAVTITGLPITCIDLTYDGAGKPIVFIGTQKVWDGVTSDWRKYIAPSIDVGKYVVGSVYWIADETFPAAWADLKLSCYGCCSYAASAPGCFDVFSIAAAPDFATSNKAYALISKPTTLSFNLTTAATITVTAGAGGATLYWTAPCPTPTAGTITDPNSATNVAGTITLGALGTDTFVANAAITPAVKVDVTITAGTATFAVTTAPGTATICNTSTQVVSTVGTVCSWTQVAELFWNCDSVTPNRFQIREASRFAFGDDFASTRGMFIGVSGTTGAGPVYGPGGDVYFVADTIPAQPALDLNVQGYVSGCLGLAHANINSLDMCGATDSGSLVAGALDGYQALSGDNINTNVWYSNDGGWSWSPSAKDPTGANTVYVIFYDDCATALAATNGCSCAISMSCGETVGQYFNQIALIDTSINQTWDMSHAPGYVTDSTIMYVLTENTATCGGEGLSNDLFRWDGTYWERVYTSMNWEYALMMDWVEVSPDFNDTGCLYLANSNFRLFRSVDQGCSWRILSYPCAPLPTITAWTVVDEETVLASGSLTTTAEWIYKTDRHGTRPWTSVRVLRNTSIQSTSDGVDFDLSPSLATDNNVLFSDDDGRVYLSKDLATTPFNEITDVVGLTPFAERALNTYCVFDPGYGTAGDPGVTMIYAAAGSVVGRCALNSASTLAKQDWVYISTASASCDPFAMVTASGIGVAGDTALYVSDTGAPGSGATATTVSGTVEIDCIDCSVGGCLGDFTFATEPVIVTGTVAFIAGELVEIVGWNLTCTTTCTEGTPDVCTFTVAGEIDFRGLSSGAVGYITFTAKTATTFNCPTCACTGTTICTSIGDVISAHLVIATTSAVAPRATGIWRTLNPMDLMPPAWSAPLVEWEFLPSTAIKFLHRQIGLAGATGVYSDDLWITQASNMLWTLETTANDTPTYNIWMWEDPLAAPVILLLPADGALLATSTSATISWNALDSALYYQVYIYSYCPTCPDNMTVFNNFETALTCVPITGLTPGTTYFWKVRVACDDPYVSKWSELRSFDTALSSIFELCSPVCGASDIVLTTNYSWDAVIGATGYELQVVAASADGTVDWTGATTYDSTTNAFASIPGLQYSTVYYWRVRAVNDGVYSAWSECIFTTMAEPVEEPEPLPPVVIEQNEITPTWIWVIIGIGGALTIAVVILIVTTRRVP